MFPFNWEWWFHWTHDRVFIDILKAFIAALGPIVAGVITWFGIRWTGKLTKQTLENTKESTPPELLRLEKWSSILKDSNDYPENIKHELDVNAIQSTYNDVLKRATLENKVIKLGILSAEVRENLISIKPSAGGAHYPKPSWDKAVLKNWAISIIITIGFLVNFIILGFGVVSARMPFWVFIIFFASFIFAWIAAYRTEKLNKIQKNIIFRNGYHALRNIYLFNSYIELDENDEEKKERRKFKNGKAYNFWYKRNKKDHPEWRTSWNYGLSISWDNNPYKSNTDGLEPNHLPPSLFRAEDPKRQEP